MSTKKKAWKKSTRTLNPSIHVKEGRRTDNGDDVCAWICSFLACFSIYLHNKKKRFTWIHGCWFCLYASSVSHSLILFWDFRFSSVVFDVVYLCSDKCQRDSLSELSSVEAQIYTPDNRSKSIVFIVILVHLDENILLTKNIPRRFSPEKSIFDQLNKPFY